MKPYLDLLREIMTTGRNKQQRAVLKDGRHPTTKALFGRQIRFDLTAGFPLVTTKKVSFGLVRDELLWFLSGSTNNNDLKRASNIPAGKSSIWEAWANQDTGEIGPIYGKQWRRWESPTGEKIDQIARLVDGIKAVVADPTASVGRRLILTAWNPVDISAAEREKLTAPMACHTLSQFDVTDGRLSCQLYQRSADMFLGVPFNTASYATLTHLLAHVTGLAVGDFIHTFGDAHVYDNSFDQVNVQLGREPKPLPRLTIDPAVRSMDGIRPDQIKLEGYDPWPVLDRVEVAV